jgi:hypothetical protein
MKFTELWGRLPRARIYTPAALRKRDALGREERKLDCPAKCRTLLDQRQPENKS